MPLLEALHDLAYHQKRHALVSYMSTLIGLGHFDRSSIVGDAESLVKSNKLVGARVLHMRGGKINTFVSGKAPDLFISASMIKPVILGEAIKKGGDARWVDKTLAHKLIVDSDNKTFEEVMKKTLGQSFSPEELQNTTDRLLTESGVVTQRDSGDRRMVDIAALAHAFQNTLHLLPENIYRALIVPHNPNETTDITAKTIAKLQARLKNNVPFLFKIGLEKDEKNRIVTSYFMQVGEDMCIGYSIGGRFAATQQLLGVASYLILKNQ